jgi:hypothetical protein
MGYSIQLIVLMTLAHLGIIDAEDSQATENFPGNFS